MAELKTIVFEPFPHGRPKQYTRPTMVDLIMSRDTDYPRLPTLSSKCQVPTMAKPAPKPRPAPLPTTGDVGAVLWEVFTNGPIRIPTLAARIAKREKHANWRAFAAAKIKAMKLIGTMIRSGMIQRFRRKFVTAVPKEQKRKMSAVP